MPSHKSVCEFLISLYRRKHEKWIEFSIRDAKNVREKSRSFMNNFRPRALWSELYQCEGICFREELRHPHPCLTSLVFRHRKKEKKSRRRHVGTLLPILNAVIIICARNYVRRCYRGPGNLFASNLNWSKVFKKNVNGFYRQFRVLNAALKFSPPSSSIKQ